MKPKTTISIQMDQDLYDFVKSQAHADGRSMGGWIKQLILLKQTPQRELPFFGQPKQIAPELAGPGGVGE